MGGVWCKSERGARAYSSPKSPWNSAISRWTDNVRNVYRKPKTYRRPPRPPQKPMRSNERLTISPPRLMTDQSSDGWRTATLTVPEAAPVPPPRKKRKRNAYSMDDLSRPELTLAVSTLSLPDRGAILQEESYESRSASTTMIVTPVIERISVQEEEEVKEENKENLQNEHEEVEDDDIDNSDANDMIIPIEKETMFSSRTLLHSNLGYIDKLSAISEVSAESGFDDRVERSESAASSVETGNASDPGHDRRQVAELNELNREIREKTAISKAAWLQSILKEDAEPYGIPRERRGSLGSPDSGLKDDDPPGQHNSLPSRLHLVNHDVEAFSVATSSPTPPPSPTNHSVLLGLLQDSENFIPREESIFLTNTRTNIIYKSLSKDKLTDDYDLDFTIHESSKGLNSSIRESDGAPGQTNQVNSSSTTPLTDYAFQSPQLVETDVGLNSLLSDVNSSFDRKPIKSQNYVSALKNLQVSSVPTTVLNGASEDYLETKKGTKDISEKKESAPSSRKSSITDSLHEFEMSIYDMLNESKKNRDSSDEEESLKTVKVEANKH